MLLTLGALVLLSTLTLNINGTLLSSASTTLEMESVLNAVSVAQSLLDEALAKSFDERTITLRVYTFSGMTSPSLLGRDAGESITGIDSTYLSRTRFDDFDDYHNYQRRVFNERLGWFNVISTVSYVRETTPDILSTNQTFAKRITVRVTNDYMPRSLANPDSINGLILQDLAVYRQYF